MSDGYRRFARLQTRKVATLTLQDGQVLDCEIRDFCPQGLLLLPLQDREGMLPGAGQQIVGAPATLSFTGGVDGAGHTHSFPGKLVRVGPLGIGMFTEHMPLDAYKALAQVRADLLSPDQAPSGLLPAEIQAILRDCVNGFRLFVDGVWRRFLEHVHLRLSEEDASPLPLSEHSRFLIALRDLHQRSGSIRRRHFDLLIERMRRLEQDRPQGEPQNGGDSELNFVDEEKFEDWLNIAAVFNRQEVEVRTPMYEFAQRFNLLVPVAIDKGNDPFGPESLCLAFQEVIRDVDMTNPMRAIVYTAFGRAIAPDYPGLYARFNQLLAPLKPVITRLIRPSESHPPSPPPPAQTAGDLLGAGEQMANQVARLTEVAERLFSLYAQGPVSVPEAPAAPPPVDAGGGHPPAAAPAAPYAHGAGPEQAWGMLQQTLQLLNRQRLAADTEAAAADQRAPGHAPAAIRIDDLLGSLGHPPAAMGAFPLSHALGTILADRETAARLPGWQAERLGLLSNLIRHATTGQPETSQIDALLVKLERPLYQAVLRGDDVLQQRDHPLRRLLNLIEQFAIVTDDAGQFIDQELYALVDSIVERVASRPDGDEATLAYVCDNLEKLLRHPIRQHRQRIAAYQELCEGQRNQQLSRLRVAEALDGRLSGRDVPTLLMRVLDIGWRQHLVLLQLRGSQADLEAAFALLDRLADALNQDVVAAAARLALLDGIAQGLYASSVDTAQSDAFLDDLKAALTSPGPRPAETLHIPKDWFSATLEPKRAVQPAAAVLHVPPRIGEWWNFRTGDRMIPMQLIWASHPPATLAFVNRSATRKTDLTLAEFERQSRRGDAGRADNLDLPLLERSEYGIVDAMFRDLAKESSRDPVTGLLNWKGWLKAIKADQAAQPGGHAEHRLCLLEFYPLQLVFDSLGVEAGEHLLADLATILRNALGDAHPVTAIRDGVFAVYLARHGAEEARRVAEHLLGKLAGYQFQSGPRQFRLSLAIGLAGFMLGVDDVEAALHRATTACNTARSRGGGGLQVYEDQGELLRERESLLAWTGEIDRMLADDSLYLRCQRIQPVAAEPGAVPYYEILLGIHQADGKEISPQAFIHAVELCKRSRDIDLWVAGSAFSWIRAHPQAFAATGGFSINLSAASLSDAEVLARLEAELGAGDLPTAKVMFEITETATLGGYGAARDFMQRLRRHGCRFCIDDFGSGNASYGYLKHLRTDTLKIDGAYVKDILTDPYDRALVKSMNDIGHSLGMKTVAEYAATEEILAALAEVGVDYVQGYAIHRPAPLDSLLAAAG